MATTKLLSIAPPNLLRSTKACSSLLHHSSSSSSLELHNNEVHFAPSLRSSVSRTPCSSTSLKVSTSATSSRASKGALINWDSLACDLAPTGYMYKMKWFGGEEFSDGELLPFGNIEINPSAAVLNQGQGVIEGLKAYKKADGSSVIFRPEENGLRMRAGADRLCMPAPTIDQFVEAVKITVSANRQWVPTPDKGFLYIRPLLIATGSALGINTVCTEYTFLVSVTPVDNYFEGNVQPVNLVIDNEFHRALPGGAGYIYAIGNYASSMRAQDVAKANGFYDVLYLDFDHSRYVEGVSTANVFMVKDKIIRTPELRGTIVPGITRESIIEIARSLGFQVEERLLPFEEFLGADEVFCTGNAIGVLPVGSISYLDNRVTYSGGGPGTVSNLLKNELMKIQMGITEDKMGWTVVI